MVFVRFLVFGFIILSIIYVSLWFYSRSVRREKLENEWAETKPEGVTRESFVEDGMTAYHAGLRPKLLLLVYVVPTVVIGAVIFISNAN